jgi:hypothetical protein
MTIDEIIEKYVALRDKKARIKAAFQEKTGEIDQAMTQIENLLLKQLQDMGVESFKTKAGTAYTSTRTSASVADWEVFLGFVQDNQAWEMLERRASKTAVDEYRKTTDDLPPGVNWREERVVNIRRS